MTLIDKINLYWRKEIESVTTSKYSIYRYLSDNRTQRYKTAENNLKTPMDLLVYIPDYAWVKENAPEVINLGENPIQYEQILLSYIRGKSQKVYVTDNRGKILNTNQEIDGIEDQIFLTLGNKDQVDIAIPVSKKPRLGFYTFDSRLYEENGEWYRERHMGNRVIQIKYKKL